MKDTTKRDILKTNETQKCNTSNTNDIQKCDTSNTNETQKCDTSNTNETQKCENSKISGIFKCGAPKTNETLETIAKRYSCRAFYPDRSVADCDLAAIAAAGLRAPSGMNRQNWQIITVKNKELIAEMEAEGMRVLSGFEDKSVYNRIAARGGRLFYGAPCLIMLSVKEAFPNGAEMIDLGIAAQNIALAAASLGIANCHCGLAAFCFAGSKREEFKRKLKFQEGYECGLAVLLGYAKEQSAPHAIDCNKAVVIE
ncbi:MAG: nitroreductase family protein [Clostridiales bacterium]|jgi:nitroreductase|nr:nitroreductase family protein [Clostridiales bacterium]